LCTELIARLLLEKIIFRGKVAFSLMLFAVSVTSDFKFINVALWLVPTGAIYRPQSDILNCCNFYSDRFWSELVDVALNRKLASAAVACTASL
jgi:hypothetical protein